MKQISKLVLASAGALLMAQSAQATLSYSNGDMLLGFRSSAGNSNLEVDLGSVTQITSILGTGQTLSFSSKFTSADITAGVGTAGSGTLNNAIWSVSAAVNLAGQVSGAAKNTLWLTSARGVNSADINTQTPALATGALNAQGNIVNGNVLTIASGFQSGTGTAASPTTATVLAAGNNAYVDNVNSGNIGVAGENIENTLGASFTTGGSPARSDFYQLTPNGSSTYLGYFELSTAGALSFVAVPESSTYAASLGVGLMALALMRAHRKSLAA